MHDVWCVRRAVPRRHRARRPHRRHAALSDLDRVGLPRRARWPLQEPRGQGQPVGHGRPGSPRLGQGPALPGQGARRGRRKGKRRRLALLGRLRRRLRGPRQEDDARRRRAARPGRCHVCGPRQRRDLQRRLGSPGRQRGALPDARGAEHRDDGRIRRHQGRRDLRPLLQHDQERIRPAGSEVRGRPPHPVAQPTGARQEARAGGAPGGRARQVVGQECRLHRRHRDLSRPLLPRPPQRRLCPAA